MADTEFFAPRDPFIGQVLGGEFTVEMLLGIGGMGSVYRAVQSLTERHVAVKILHRHLIDDVLVRRFKQEAQIISKLNHPNIVTVYRYGQHEDGTLFIAMEYLDGMSLLDLVQGRALVDPKRSLPLMIQMAEAVAYAHEGKIIHRDLKPENIIVVRTGRVESVKILDFGIAKILDDNFVITKAGLLCGSPPYMAPEQWLQVHDLDGRVDIYALGCVYYAMLTGRLPFEAESNAGYMQAHLKDDLVPPAHRSDALAAAPELNEIILRCLARDREARFTDAYELAEVLRVVQRRLETEGPRDVTTRPVRASSGGYDLPVLPDTPVPMAAPAPSTVASVDARSPAAAEKPDVRATAPTLADSERIPDGQALVTPRAEPGRHSALGRAGVTQMGAQGLRTSTRFHLLVVAAGLFMIFGLTAALIYLWATDYGSRTSGGKRPAPAVRSMREPDPPRTVRPGPGAASTRVVGRDRVVR